MQRIRLFALARMFASLMLFLALSDLPYGYYVLIRWVVCGVTAYGAFVSFGFDRKGWAWIFGIIAVLFNPIIIIHLAREIWAPIDIAVALTLIISLFFIPTSKEKFIKQERLA